MADNIMLSTLKRALDVGTPLACIATADQQGTALALVNEFKAQPVVGYDAVRGPYPLNDEGKAALAKATGNRDYSAFAQFPDAANAFLELPPETLAIIFNAHRFIEQAAPSTAVLNMRDV